MTLAKDGSTFYAECDFCGDCSDTDEPEFMSALDHIKKRGWLVFQLNGEWHHKCSVCRFEEDGEDFEEV